MTKEDVSALLESLKRLEKEERIAISQLKLNAHAEARDKADDAFRKLIECYVECERSIPPDRSTMKRIYSHLFR